MKHELVEDYFENTSLRYLQGERKVICYQMKFSVYLIKMMLFYESKNN